MIDPELVKYLEGVLAKRASFFDYTKLDKGLWNEYRNDALQITKSEVFNNELNHLITDTITNTVLHATDFAQVEQARTYILALQEFKQRLESIEDPKTNILNTNPHESI